ncbi:MULTISPECIES: Hsp33 family molecular chaperone HslO [unclassified Herbaspirillum]|uniref:Hsp33 family molecular chaperone HslO n=1 Tax=unclassified Herbaspirillum TaxID=2624150 RepID=UPI000E2E81B0|nr:MULTISPECIES: Hsp33 family molecular chaperone HslO [unclassified Herbaspirillum]RFB73526.1 Hsp33 family molecular chaperone HslO [Herbaspirillum sp. 3R-3a1]TFI10667.1 Hsp33 family molecular chaperone HslO [Herbaspirillum sp. 3R11]TFI16574.1 Hsp33 family molecular chaperone HslO [Herbaspirillum sp. 3R-11]TFI26023.1 Hsp33 family molecular chaperone HslO [Herbaspirillum sp. 3C11]
MKDTLQKFMVENAPVRGELVEISSTWQQVLARRDYPAAVKALLGQMLSAAALLTANLKFNGTVVMQIHGDGPVRLLVVECDSELRLRATAKLVEDAEVADDATLTQLVNVNGEGRFAITLDPKDKMPGQQAYQGIVPLDGDSVATVIENYMLRSEQLDTKLWLAADDKVSRGLLLQKLPNHGGKDVGKAAPEDELETWNRLSMLGNTLRAEELLSTDIETLMHRLFWEETIRVFDPVHPEFHCTCSREKVGNMLKMLGQAEIEEALATEEKLSVDCDFCGLHYEFDAVDCAQIFRAETPADAVPQTDTRH